MDAKLTYRGQLNMMTVTHRQTLCLILQLLLVTASAVAQPLSSQTRIVPDATWVRIYFEPVDKLAGRFGFKPLRSIAIKPGDLEVRIWSGFGISGFGGSIIKRIKNKWSVFSLTSFLN